MDEFPEEAAVEWLQTYIDENHEFLSWLGTTVDGIGDGRMRMTIPYDRKLTNTPPNGGSGGGGDGNADGGGGDEGNGAHGGEMHGGVAATLIDTSGGLALRTALDDPMAGSVATINLNVNYLRRATGDLTADAQVVRAGESVGVSQITVESRPPDGNGDEEPRTVATGQGAYRLFRAD